MAKQGSIMFSWLVRPHSLVFTISVLFLIIFGAGYYIWLQHYDAELKDLISSDKTTANLLSGLLSEHQRTTIAILQAYSNRPAFMKGVKEKDSKKVLPRLVQLREGNKKIDIVFVADTKGVLWIGYPFDSVPLNKNFSYRDWFKGVSKEWKPYVSSVYKRLIGTQELAVATCVPVFDKNGQPIGILANPQSLSFLTTIIRQVPFSDYAKVTLVDQAGYIIYSSKFPHAGEVSSYPYFPLIQKTIQEHKNLIEIKDTRKGSVISHATLAPMKDIGWTVIIERTDRDILRANHGHLAVIAAFSFLFFIFLSLSLFYIRKSFLLSETEKLLEMGESLREKEERYRTFINSTSDIVFLKDEALRHIIANDALLDFFGKKLEDVIGKTDFELQPECVAEECSQTDRKALKSANIIITEELIGNRTYETRKFPVRLPEDRVGVGGFVRDITERKEAEEKLSYTMENLHKAMGATIQLIAQVAETKDPYTAGHQKRVSNLSRAIAREMGLSDDVVDGIRMAGAIHDIGKISVPAEILSKPTKLTDIEFSLIKTHVQTGYDILKDVAFPWPIAAIVHQHHERMDGSGYPQGLRGEQILLEAQIIAVADVVEAISSHRPYRPGLGIDVALEEIEKNKGVLYDEKVVEACLKLFREKGFGFD